MEDTLDETCIDCGYSSKLLNDCFAATGHTTPPTTGELLQRIEDLEERNTYQRPASSYPPSRPTPPPQSVSPTVRSVMDA